MAKVKITGHASGTGVITVTAPNTSTDRTITLPDSSGTILDTTSTLDATKLSGTVAGFTSTGIDDNATSTAITINASENVGVGRTSNIDHPIDIQKADNAYARISSATTQENAGILLANQNTTKWTIEKYGSSHNLFIRNTSTDSLELTQDGRGLSQFTAKAWVHFTGSGTVAIRDSHNVSSITDNGVGTYTVNFTNALANDDFAVSGFSGRNSYPIVAGSGNVRTTSTVKISTGTSYTSFTAVDVDSLNIIVFGN